LPRPTPAHLHKQSFKFEDCRVIQQRRRHLRSPAAVRMPGPQSIKSPSRERLLPNVDRLERVARNTGSPLIAHQRLQM